jgi:hypothetical protein
MDLIKSVKWGCTCNRNVGWTPQGAMLERVLGNSPCGLLAWQPATLTYCINTFQVSGTDPLNFVSVFTLMVGLSERGGVG